MLMLFSRLLKLGENGVFRLLDLRDDLSARPQAHGFSVWVGDVILVGS